MKKIDLLDIIYRNKPPEPWVEGEKIPWNEPGFSQRMLEEHLSQAHDHASRRLEKIERHVQWIHNQVLNGEPARILDLGCGPGLYCSRLTKLGHTCVGIDFSPASIAYAKEQAAEQGLNCIYRLGDLLQVDFGSGYDLVMLIFGEFNAFKSEHARLILEKAHGALKDGSLLLLEVSTVEGVREMGTEPESWYGADRGLFSHRPHLVLQESFWDDRRYTATNRFFVIDAQSGEIERLTASTQAYTNETYLEMLTEAGFLGHHFHPSLDGATDPSQKGFFVIEAHKGVEDA